jgi:nitrous oxide reductase accessory protein NosL
MKKPVLFIMALLLMSPAFAGQEKPGPKDKCAVCGMFVAKYPDWVASVEFDDGSHAFFDGAKDMFKFYFNTKKYNPSKSAQDIRGIYVTEYYSLTPIDGRKAYYVTGSDVYGPMGREIVPFGSVDAAGEFMKDHNGKRLLRFEDITGEMVRGLDR